MPTSDARILANRQNSLKSKGPTSASGKEISRRNSLKHGMTGQGIVIPEGDAAEVERRKVILANELAPNSLVGSILVGQMATLSVRMEQGARQELAATAIRVRHAADVFDEERLAEARGLFRMIGDDPRETLRKLRKSPEGVDLMLLTWRELRAGLALGPAPRWTSDHSLKAANLSGLRESELPRVAGSSPS